MSKLQDVENAVVSGKSKLVAGLVQEALDEGCSAPDILNGMINAMGIVGERFKKNEIFVPEMLVAARAMKKGVDVLKPHLASGSAGVCGKAIIGTVAGDLHDIGKNLVALMLKNYGFRVVDLGKDVPKEDIVQAAIDEKADIIALSALMTTTMMRMKDVVELVREKNVDAKVIIGGAVITQSYADEIGADGYSKDAADAVRLVQRLMELV